MIIEQASNILKDVSISQVSDIFFYIIFGGVLGTVYGVLTNKKWKLIEVSPSLFTTIGILGTFFGIFIGLLNFDPQTHETIDKRIPFLLSGLKTAFLTSVLGITASILMKFLIAFKKGFSKDDGSEDEVHLLMSKLDAGTSSLESINNNILTLDKRFEEVKKVVAGEGEATVVTQIQKSRADLNDGFKELTKTLNTIKDVKFEEYHAEYENSLASGVGLGKKKNRGCLTKR